jgi:hypothetical protein
VHASGHRARLNRKTLTDLCLFGDPTYAKEELVAEMGAAYLSGICGIAHTTIANSAAYLQSWMAVLRHDATLLVQAAAQAQRAADYIQNLYPATGTEDGRAHATTPGVGHSPRGSNASACSRAEGHTQERAAPPRTRTAARSSSTLLNGRDDHGNCTTPLSSL